MRAALVGLGAVGVAAAGALLADDSLESLLVVPRRRTAALNELEGSDPRLSVFVGGAEDLPDGLDVVVLAVPSRLRAAAAAALAHGAHVVASSDDPHEVAGLLTLEVEARERHRVVVAGAAMAPGLSCVLARYAGDRLDRVDEIHVASLGTGGPACARRHHAALSTVGRDWQDGAWRRRSAGSGRELVWFPEPLGGADCYRAALPDPALLHPAFPGARRITARLAATRRDRTTAWLPMLRPPHPEGRAGAVRVEVRGWSAGKAETEVVGAVARPALAAGAVAAVAARWAAGGEFRRPGAAGLASLVEDPGRYLQEVTARGVRLSRFEGVDAVASTGM